MLNKSTYSRLGVAPQALSGTTAVNGTGIDRHAAANSYAEDVRVVAITGAVANTPTSFTVTAKLQHASADIEGLYGDVADWDADNKSSVVLTDASSVASFPVDARGLKQFVRVVLTPAFVGGAAPTVMAGATLEFSRPRNEPVS